MSSVNLAVISGRLGRDIDVRNTTSGKVVASLNVATESRYKKDGEWQSKTEWHRVVWWSPPEKAQSLTKGAAVTVQGRLQTRKWEKDGVDRYMTEIVADRVIYASDSSGQGDGDDPF